MSDELKFCVNCRHFGSAPGDSAYDVCMARPQINLVTGATRLRNPTLERAYLGSDSCGRDAKWFEPKVPG